MMSPYSVWRSHFEVLCCKCFAFIFVVGSVGRPAGVSAENAASSLNISFNALCTHLKHTLHVSDEASQRI